MRSCPQCFSCGIYKSTYVTWGGFRCAGVLYASTKFLWGNMHIYLYVYVYIYIYREREGSIEFGV